MIGLDGADPYVCKRLVAEGRMPNLKKLLEKGVAREGLDMMGVLPTITPPNWATLATGVYPRTHGVTCFLNHTLGKSLGITEMNWDSRRVHAEMIWEAFAAEGKKSIMLNYCEAWPPRFDDEYGVYIDGTGVMPFMAECRIIPLKSFINNRLLPLPICNDKHSWKYSSCKIRPSSSSSAYSMNQRVLTGKWKVLCFFSE